MLQVVTNRHKPSQVVTRGRLGHCEKRGKTDQREQQRERRAYGSPPRTPFDHLLTPYHRTDPSPTSLCDPPLARLISSPTNNTLTTALLSLPSTPIDRRDCYLVLLTSSPAHLALMLSPNGPYWYPLDSPIPLYHPLHGGVFSSGPLNTH